MTKQRIALVTGGAQGIGYACAEALAADGARLVLADINADGVKAAAEKLGNGTVAIACDVADPDQISAMFDQIEAEVGTVEVLVNNAARDDRHDWRDVTAEYWDERQNNNLRHMFFAIQAVADGMIAAGGGSIINMGSNSWWEAGGGFPASTTAKAAVHGLTRTMARDLGSHRIRVNTVVPGWIMTERQKELWVTPEALAKQIERQCLPDPIDPIYVARMVLFLASDDSSACSANNFMVEGGSI